MSSLQRETIAHPPAPACPPGAKTRSVLPYVKLCSPQALAATGICRFQGRDHSSELTGQRRTTSIEPPSPGIQGRAGGCSCRRTTVQSSRPTASSPLLTSHCRQQARSWSSQSGSSAWSCSCSGISRSRGSESFSRSASCRDSGDHHTCQTRRDPSHLAGHTGSGTTASLRNRGVRQQQPLVQDLFPLPHCHGGAGPSRAPQSQQGWLSTPPEMPEHLCQRCSSHQGDR